MNWTTEQIMALAPDAASAKAGQGLAAARKWLSLGVDEQAVWGLCQGSGKDPYQAQIDLTDPAFRCSCPSRKFPCKHGLGLFLLLAAQPAAFKEKKSPDWVVEWMASRAKRAEQRTEKQARAEAGEKIVDEAAQAKRAASREAKVAAGLRDLELWLRDIARGGLAAVGSQPPNFWERTAARLVDAQAPGVARLVREMAGVPASGEGWEARLLERLGKLYLLIEGFKRIVELPEARLALGRAERSRRVDIAFRARATAARREFRHGRGDRCRTGLFSRRASAARNRQTAARRARVARTDFGLREDP
jgi:SWIM zinc finger